MKHPLVIITPLIAILVYLLTARSLEIHETAQSVEIITTALDFTLGAIGGYGIGRLGGAKNDTENRQPSCGNSKCGCRKGDTEA